MIKKIYRQTIGLYSAFNFQLVLLYHKNYYDVSVPFLHVSVVCRHCAQFVVIVVVLVIVIRFNVSLICFGWHQLLDRS